MALTTACPDTRILQQFALGQMPPAEVDCLAEHVAQCERCVEVLHTLKAEDTLVERLATQTTTADPPLDEAVKTLIQQLKRMPSPVAADREAELTASAGSAGGHPSEELVDFLAPAQSPDELGRLGPYRVLQVLGSGGMGIVFQAEDPQLRRAVALKVMKPALAASATARRRFLREARAMAALEHDHIVAVYQVGEDRGLPFLAMPLLKGDTLHARLEREYRLPLAEVLRIGRETAAALAAAHDGGLIHRDIKPANIWLESSRGRVKVLDFGLARPAKDEGLTQQGGIVGTPAYMAPEQAQGRPVDARGDLFSLGCVLYRACTGQLPFRGATSLSTLDAVVTEHPAAPQELNPDVPPALNDLIVRLLAKDVADRPASAAAVVQAIETMERPAAPSAPATVARPEPRPVASGITELLPPRPGARASVARRRRWVAVAAALCLVGGGLMAAQLILRITHKDGKTREIELQPGDKLELVQKQPSSPRAPGLFDALRREDIPAYELAAAGGGDPRQAPANLVAILGDSRMKHWSGITALAFSPDGQTLISGSDDHTVRFWNPATGQEKRVLTAPTGVMSLAISADGSTLLSAGGHFVRVWDMATGQERLTLENAGFYLALSADGTMLATAGGLDVIIRSLPSGKELRTLKGHTEHIDRLVFSPDGKTLATASRDKTVKLWDVDTGQERRTLKGHTAQVNDVAFSPDGKTLASVSHDGWGRLWDVLTGQELRRLGGDSDAGVSVTFSPDGQTVAYGDMGGSVKLWNLANGTIRHTLREAGARVAISPDGKTLATAARREGIRLWEVATGQVVLNLPGHEQSVTAMAVSPDGKTVATASYDRTVKLWDVASGKEQSTLRGHKGEIHCVAFSPDGKTLVSGGAAGDYTVRLWDSARGELRCSFPGHGNGVLCVAISPDGKTLASGGYDQTVILWDLTGLEDPDEGAMRTARHTLKGHTGSILSVGFSPDGRTLASSSDDKTARLWDVATGAALRTLAPGHDQEVKHTVFSPDGKTLATTGSVERLKLWNVATGQELRDFRGGGLSVAFSPDGQALIASGYAGKVNVWDLNPGSGRRPRQTFVLGPPGGAIRQITFSPDGRHLLTSNENGTVYILRLERAPAP